jgi:hypothetical protein
MKKPTSMTSPMNPTQQICQMLRWKGHSREATTGEQQFAFARNQVPYTCLRTCQPWGPDDEPAVPEGCDAGRSCFAAPTLRDA